MDCFDPEMDMEGHCVVTATQPLKEALEPLSDFEDHWQRTEGGILPGSEYAWLSRGPRFRVVSTLTGASVMDWSFNSPLERAVITCAIPLPVNFGLRHNGKQDIGLRLAVGLIVEGHGGLVVVLATGPAIRTRVLNSVRVYSKVLSMALVTSEMQDDDESPLHSALCRMQGVLALGLLGGEVLLLDLRADDSETDRFGGGETHVMPFTVRDDLVHKMAEAAITGDHLALMLNSGSFVEGQFMLQSPDGRVKSKSSKNLVGVPSLLYVPQLASLCIGFSFGVFQLWSLADFTLLLTSPLLESPLPVVRLSWQPPSDDPRACCYLWAAHAHQGSRRNPMAALYALTWERCRRIAGYGDLYLTLQSCRLVFELEVAPVDHADDVSLMDVQTVTRRPPAGDASLALFSWSAGHKAGALLFDLDQWYKAQMPNRVCAGAETFLARYSVDHDGDTDQPYLAARLNDASVTRFDAIRLREEHFFPASTSFHTTWLLGDCVLRATHPGVQAQALKALTRAGPIGIAAPTVLFRRCVNAGLRPTLSDAEPTFIDSTESQREFLLSLCLERQPRLALRCALHWADGIQEVLGGSLNCWLEWAWQQARAAKTTADAICVPLFDLSGRSLDSMAHAMLLLAIGHVCQLASIFKQLRDHLADRRLTTRLEETEERCAALTLVSLYLGGVRWFVTAALLPERPESDPILANVPFPAVALADNYRQRRVELQRTHQTGELLYIDALVARHPRVATLWQQEGGDGRYPPPSLQAILRVHLLDDMDEDHKHLLIFYLLQDLATLQRYDGLDSEGLVSSYPSLTPAQRQLARALWLLDHRDFDDAVLALASARPEPWQRNLALRALHAQGRHRLAAQLLHNGGAPPGLAGHRLGVSILLHCDRLTDALAMLRKEGTVETMPLLLEHFFRGCQDNNAMGQALRLSLRPNEEEVLFRFLERECGGARGLDMRALYLLSHSRIVEATALAPPPGQPAASTRDLLLAAYTRTLPQITLDVAAFCRRQRGDIARFTTVSRPEPLTVGVRQTASQETLFAASLMATAAASRTPPLTSAHTQQLPFLRSPRFAAVSVSRHTPAIVPCSVSTPTPGSKRKRELTDADELLMTPRVRRRIQESPSVHRPASILKARAVPEMSTPPSTRKIRFSLKQEESMMELTPSISLKGPASFLDEPAPNKTVYHEPVIKHVEDSDPIKIRDGIETSSSQGDDVLLSTKEVNVGHNLIHIEENANVIEKVEDLDSSAQEVEDLDSSAQEVEDLDSSAQEVEDLDSSAQEVEDLDSSVQEVEDSDIEELEVSEIPRSRQLLLDDSRPCLVQNRFENRRIDSEAESEISIEETSVEDSNVSKKEDARVCVEEADDDAMYKENNDYVEEELEIPSKEANAESDHQYDESVDVKIEAVSCKESNNISVGEVTAKEGELNTYLEAEEEELRLAEDVEEDDQLDKDDIYEAMDVDQVEDVSEGTDVPSSENILGVPSSELDVAQAYRSSQESLEVPTCSELSENPFPRDLDRPVSEYFHQSASSTDLEENVEVDLEEAIEEPGKCVAAAKTKADGCDEDEDNEESSQTSYRKRVSRPKFIDLDDEEDDEDEEDEKDGSVDLEDKDDEETNKIAAEKFRKKVSDSPTSSELGMLMKNAPEEEEAEAEEEEEEDLDESLEEEEDDSESRDEDSQSVTSSSSDIICLDEEPTPLETEPAVLTPLLPVISAVWTKEVEENEEEMLNRAIRMSTEQHEELRVVDTRDADGDQAEADFECGEDIGVDQNEEEPESDPLVEDEEDEEEVQDFGNTSTKVQMGDNNGESMDEAAVNEGESFDESATDQDELNRAIQFMPQPNEETAADGSSEELEIHASPKWETGSDASSVDRKLFRAQLSDAATATKSEDLKLSEIKVSEPKDILTESESSTSNRRQLRSSGQQPAMTTIGKTTKFPVKPRPHSESEEKEVLAIRVSESEGSAVESDVSSSNRSRTRSSYSQPSVTVKTRSHCDSESDDLELPVFRVSESEDSPERSSARATHRRQTRSSVLGNRTPENPGNKGDFTELNIPLSQSSDVSPARSDKSSVYLKRISSTLLGSQSQTKEEDGSPTSSETGSVNRRRTRSSWVMGSQEEASDPLKIIEEPVATHKDRRSWAGRSPAQTESSSSRRRTSASFKIDVATEVPKGVRQRRCTGEIAASPSPSIPPRSSSALGWVGSDELEEFTFSRRLTRQQRSMLERNFTSRAMVSVNPDEEEAVAPVEGDDSDDNSSTASVVQRRASFLRAMNKMSPARSRAGSLPPSRGPRSLDGDFNDNTSDVGSDVTKPNTKTTRSRRVCASLGGAASLAELNTIMEESTVAEPKPGPSRKRSRAGSLPPSPGPRSVDSDVNDGTSETGSNVTEPDAKSTRSRRLRSSLGGAPRLAELNTITEESTVAEPEPDPSRNRSRHLSPVSEETHHLRRRSQPANTKLRSSLMLRGKRTSFDAAPRKSKK